MATTSSNFCSKDFILKESAEPVWTQEEKETFLVPLWKTINAKTAIEISVTNQSKLMLNRFAKVIKEATNNPVFVYCSVNHKQWILFANRLICQLVESGWGQAEFGAAQIKFVSHSIIFPKNKDQWAITPFKHLMFSMEEVIMLIAGQSVDTPVDQLEWQFGIENCLEEDIKNVIELLGLRGFKVAIKPLSMRINHSLIQKELKIYQNLVVSLPKDHVMPPDDASWINYGDIVPRLSANNYLILRKQLLKESPDRKHWNDFIPEDEYFEKIIDDLKFIAEKTPLVRRFTSDISRLDPGNRESLQKRLKDLGYEVGIETPYLTIRDFEDYRVRDYLRHNLVILLPEQPE